MTSDLTRMDRRKSVADATSELAAYLSRKMDKLHRLWDEVGMTDEMRGSRVLTAYKEVKNLLEAMEAEEIQMVAGVKKRVEKYKTEVSELCNQLHLVECEIDPAMELLDMMDKLTEVRKNLLAQKQDRIARYQALYTEEKDLCEQMSEKTEAVADWGRSSHSVPSQVQIKLLSERIQKLWTSIHTRKDTFERQSKELKRLLDIMKLPAPNKFANDLLQSPNLFRFSEANMSALDHVLKSVETAYDEYVQKFQQRYDEKYGRLESMWKKCLSTDTEKAKILPFSEDTISEQVLTDMDAEFDRLTQNWEAKQDVLKELERWQQLWKEKLDFEKRENDPARYMNRGGNLQRLLKRQKQIEQCLLPTARQNLQSELDKWNRVKSGEPILVANGLDPAAYVDAVVEQHARSKQLLKQNKMSAKKERMERELKYGTTPTKMSTQALFGERHRTPVPGLNSQKNLAAPEAEAPKAPRTGHRSPVKPFQLSAGVRQAESGATKRQGSPDGGLSEDTVDYHAFTKGVAATKWDHSDSPAHSSILDSSHSCNSQNNNQIAAKKPPLPTNRRH